MPNFRIFSRRSRRSSEIQPDEILIDSATVPSFDSDQFEGRIERPISRRSIVLLMGMFGLVACAMIVRTSNLQLIDGTAYASLSEENRLSHVYIFADRGEIVDRNGVELAYDSHETGAEVPRRVYAPYRGIAHIVGYAKAPAKDASGEYYQDRYVGVEGIERALDATLQGTNGLKISETDARGKVISESTIADPKHGEKVSLSIDVRLNQELYDAIASRAEASDFQSGAAAIMDVRTGEMLAFVSYPEYAPQVLADRTDQAKIRAYLADSRMTFLDRVAAGQFTPGSIVKPFFALAALEEGIISPSKQIQSTGAISIPNPYAPDKPTIFRDWKAHGWTDMQKAIAVSSDVYFYAIGGGYGDQPGLGIDKLGEYARMFGFGSETGIGTFTESEGVVPSREWKEKAFPDDPTWRLGNTYHTAIGQYGFQVTPLQVLRAVSALANGGVLLTPTVIAGEQGPRTTLSITPANLEVVEEGMRKAASPGGTAQALSVNYVDIAGKTGTAELGVNKDRVNSWVMGYFPYESPRYAFVMILERGPRANLFGSAGVMREVFDWMHIHTPEYLEATTGR